MASAVDKQPTAARLAAVAAAGYLPTATNRSQNSYTTSGDTTAKCNTVLVDWPADVALAWHGHKYLSSQRSRVHLACH